MKFKFIAKIFVSDRHFTDKVRLTCGRRGRLFNDQFIKR